MPLAIFGIDNSGINLGITFVILSLVAIWIALIVFTYSDARRRISDPFLIACSTAASFFPYVGTIVYTVLRPPEFLDDVNERETEMKAAETRMRHLDANSCRKCGFPTQPDFVRCPACRTRLKEPCPSCSRPVGLKWKVCPYCEHTLIESKRSRSSSKKGSQGRRPPEGRDQGSDVAAGKSGRLRRRDRTEATEPEGSEASTRSDGTESETPDTRSGRRTGRRASRSETAAMPRSPERAASADVDSGQDAGSGSDRTARSATRSDRRGAVVADDEPAAAKTINGGDSEQSGRKSEAD